MDYGHAYRELTASKLFRQWQKEHPRAYLSHFYSSLSNDFSTGTWEIGFYHPDHDKITVFVIADNIEMKPESEVFKSQGTVEELDIQRVAIGQQDALAIVQHIHAEKYPNEHLLKGFLILQQFHHQLMWNISFVTQRMTILNVKIDAITGSIIADNVLTVVEQKK
jgi:hypothetical protein